MLIDGKRLKSLLEESGSLYPCTSTLLVSFHLVEHFVVLHVGPLPLLVMDADHK